MTEQASDAAMVDLFKTFGLNVEEFDDGVELALLASGDEWATILLSPAEARGLAAWLLREAAAVEGVTS